MNLIVGQNNVGKSSLLRSLTLGFQARPHVSEITQPTPTTPLNPQSKATVELGTTGPEVREIMLTSGTAQYFVALPPGFDATPSTMPKFLGSLVESQDLCLEFNVVTSDPNSNAIFAISRFPSHGQFSLGAAGSINCAQANIRPDRQGFDVSGPTGQQAPNEMGMQLAPLLRQRIYLFRAERMQISRANFGHSFILQPDCSNLAEVLNMLSSDNSALYREVVGLVGEIIPSVRWVSVVPIPNNQVEIRVWQVDESTQASHLAIPLDECGTGVGQVLAMLYVVVTSKQPRVILIDEPASFLHPGAARKLLSILGKYEQHQYIISTHSPEIISISRSSPIFLVRSEGAESKIDRIDPTQLEDAKLALDEVGARLSDVYGADNIVWVEGPTEVECFPLIAEKFGLGDAGTVFCPIRNTGSITSKRTREQILGIYRSLSQPKALNPPALAFVFDRERLSNRDVDDLERHKAVRILNRKMYENYIIDAGAITDVLNNTETFRGTSEVTTDQVKLLLQQDIGDESIETIDGAGILERLFSELSDGKEEYRKTTHSVDLTRILLEKDTARFSELRELLAEILCNSDEKND